MGPAWLAALVCLGTMAVVHSAAVPTQETLVVARSDEPSTTPAPPKSEDVTTSEPLPPIKLSAMEVKSEVALRYAHTEVLTRVKNPAKQSQEATFRVLLPETAFISGFVMILNDKPYKAYVKEKDEAKKIYNDAVSQGIGAAHIATKARDSNHFTVSVNVEPNTEAVFNLTYEELLDRRNGVYNHAINLHPGVVVPKMTVRVHIKEAQKITQLRVPEVRTGNEVDATEDDAQNSKALIERGHDDREATISFSPDAEEQKRLMEIYAVKTKESRDVKRQPWASDGEQEDGADVGVLGQFVVQYDVERPKDGEILVNDGYFVHFFAPPALPPLPKHVVFVLDTSGSMMDRKILQLREAMQSILSKLNTGDYFTIVEFSSYVQVHDLKEALEDKPPRMNYYYEQINKPLTLVPPFKATPENIDKAKVIISRLRAEGGTNIDEALSVAIDLIRKGINWTATTVATTPEPQPTPVPLQTSDKIEVASTTAQAPKLTTPEADGDDTNKLEPIIIFLTDGEATVGETDPKRIISRLSEKNYGPNKATIFSLAFGEDADRSLLRKLSLQNEGFMRHIYEAADAALQLRDFYKQVASPLLAHVKFTYPAEQVKEGSLTKRSFRSYYAGSERIVAGRLEDVAELTPQIEAFCGNDDGFGKKKYSIFPKVPVAKKRDHYLPLERVWAYITIKQLLDQKDVADTKHVDKEDTPEKKALALALKYEFVTPLTSLVVVKPNATKAVDAESVDKESGPPSYNFAPLAASFASNPSSQIAFQSIPSASIGAYSQSANHFSGRRRYINRKLGMKIQSKYLTDGEELQDANIKSLQKSEGGLAYDHQDSQPSVDFEENDYDIVPETAPKAGFGGALYLSPANRIFGGGLNLGHNKFIGAAQGLDITEDDLDEAILPGVPSPPFYQRPAILTTPVITSSTIPPTPLVLTKYHLEKFPWTESLINATDEKLEVPVNGSTVLLKLTNDDINVMVPDETYKNETCARAVGTDAPGVCVYLTRCIDAQNITVAQYADLYCKVKFGLAGVCCSESSVVVSGEVRLA